MLIGQKRQPPVDVAAGPGFAVLVALARVSRDGAEHPELASALADVGDTAGETWLNLLGVPLDAGPPYTTERLLDALEELGEVELRRHLLGRYAWSWCALAGVDDIDAAAAGDASAGRRLLEHPRYYAGHASDSLQTLLFLDRGETQRRIHRAVEAGAGLLADERMAAALSKAETAAKATLRDLEPLEAVERITGYRYVPEPEAERVILVPHAEAAPQLVLAQHRGARLVAYRAAVAPGAEERLLALGRALSDPKRVEILGLVSRGTGRVPELVERTGLSRSTVHHHLAHLRDAGLVVLEGNARGHTFAPRADAPLSASAALAEVIGGPNPT